MNKLKNSYQVQEKGRISSRQLAFLIITLVIASADVFLPRYVAQEAKQDAWISVIVSTIFALLTASIFLSLGMKYPDKTLVQYACDILGKPIGKMVGLLYILYFFSVAKAVTTELGEIFVSAFNPKAPLFVFSLVTLAVSIYTVSKGLEVIARLNELLLPLGIAILGLIVLVNIKNMDMKNFLPILPKGPIPPLKGALLIQAWLLEAVVVLQFLPMTTGKKIKRDALLAIAFVGSSLQFGVLVIAVFGPLVSQMLFPALEYVRYASVGKYFQNLDITIMGIWITGLFIKITVFLYASVHAASQLFGFRSYKHLTIPFGILTASASVASFERILDILHFTHFIFPFYSLTMGFIFPLILLLASAFRKKPAMGRITSCN